MATDINISNYEQYLYSYVDGELSPEEHAAFDLFLQQHPQARQELELLNSTRLQPDPGMHFENKSSLYRGTNAINPQQYQQYLLSYIDGELTPAEQTTFEQLLKDHAHIAKELEIWQATKLQPDTTIQFTNKKTLYRHTAAKRIHPAWWTAAAAAAVAGWLLWSLPASQDNSQDNIQGKSPVAAIQPATPATTPAPAPAPTTATPATAATASPATSATARAANGNKQAAATRKGDNNSSVPTPDAQPATTQQLAAHSNEPAENMNTLKLPQPRNTSEEVVKAHINKEVNTSSITVKTPDTQQGTLLANNTQLPATDMNMTATPPPTPPGELIMSVSSSRDSKLMDKVTNVARFFGRKKR